MTAPDPSRVLVTSDDPRLLGTGQPSAHTHPVSEVDGLQDALDGKAATGHTHTKAQVGLGNVDNTSDAAKPVSTATQAALDGKAATSHTHTTAQVTGLDSALAGKASTSHTHSMSQVTGLDSALSGKAAVSHTHTAAEVGAEPAAWSGTQAQFDALGAKNPNRTYYILP